MFANDIGFTRALGKSIYYEFINRCKDNETTPLLVFLHEGLGCTKQWKDFPRLLSDAMKYPAFLYDRYGYGNSAPISDSRDSDFISKEALQFLPEIFSNLGLQNRKKILIGHSDGGSIALVYAAAFPDSVKAVITEAAHVFIEDISIEGIQAVVNEYQHGLIKEKLMKYHGENTDSMFNSWTRSWLSTESKKWNIEKYLLQINCPLLAIQGTDDEYGTYAQLESIKKHTSDKTELLYISGCGHTPHFDAREIVFNAIIRVLSF